MLILIRKPEEALRIGNDIKITVTDIAGGQVKLGIEAPDHVEVLRSELAKPRLNQQPKP